MNVTTKAAKDYAYRALACALLDYVELCAEKRLVPLKHDANVFRTRLHQNDSRRLA